MEYFIQTEILQFLRKSPIVYTRTLVSTSFCSVLQINLASQRLSWFLDMYVAICLLWWKNSLLWHLCVSYDHTSHRTVAIIDISNSWLYSKCNHHLILYTLEYRSEAYLVCVIQSGVSASYNRPGNEFFLPPTHWELAYVLLYCLLFCLHDIAWRVWSRGLYSTHWLHMWTNRSISYSQSFTSPRTIKWS